MGFARAPDMDSFFDRALLAARRLGASDVHLKPGLAPILRIAGELRTLSDVPPLSREFLHSLGLSLLNDRRREALERTGDVVVALATSNGGRQRAHLYHHRGGLSLSLRLIPPEVPALDTLGLPAEARALTEPGAGLVVVAAGPGAGKTTTLAALVEDVTARRPCRVLTIEDPVEHLLRDRRGVVVQREVGTDIPSTAAGLRAAVRQDVDLLMIGELADAEAIRLAVEAAEAGRLVLAGLGAGSTAQMLERLTRPAPGGEAELSGARLAAVLRGAIVQRLVPAAGGRRRGPAGTLLRV
ncbi:MAG TPA: ATPase, T2SS/T4P/T4SS family, partial [Polyangia bacterium]|nr:ATPase, T2SS/T4P/T4SS family [Polyangia bacterium]